MDGEWPNRYGTVRNGAIRDRWYRSEIAAAATNGGGGNKRNAVLREIDSQGI